MDALFTFGGLAFLVAVHLSFSTTARLPRDAVLLVTLTLCVRILLRYSFRAFTLCVSILASRQSGKVPHGLDDSQAPAAGLETDAAHAFTMLQARAVLDALRWYLRNAPAAQLAGEKGLRLIQAERRLPLIVASSNGSKHNP